MSDEIIIPLSRPLQTHDGEIRALTLREPTARCFFEYGEPFKTRFTESEGGKPLAEVDYNYRVLKRWLEDMIVEKVDDLVLGGLRPTDFVKLRDNAALIILGVAGSNPT